jgi:hypothetical protein
MYLSAGLEAEYLPRPVEVPATERSSSERIAVSAVEDSSDLSDVATSSRVAV